MSWLSTSLPAVRRVPAAHLFAHWPRPAERERTARREADDDAAPRRAGDDPRRSALYRALQEALAAAGPAAPAPADEGAAPTEATAAAAPAAAATEPAADRDDAVYRFAAALAQALRKSRDADDGSRHDRGLHLGWLRGGWHGSDERLTEAFARLQAALGRAPVDEATGDDAAISRELAGFLRDLAARLAPEAADEAAATEPGALVDTLA